jgi:hypothetical protein
MPYESLHEEMKIQGNMDIFMLRFSGRQPWGSMTG